MKHNVTSGEQPAGTLVASVSSITNVNPAERAISVISGIALAVNGIRHFNQGKGISSLLGGAYLLARGISGYCVVNALLQKTKYARDGFPQATGTFKVVAEN